MRYSAAGHAVNILFILAVVLAPISICLANPSIPVEVGRAVIILSFGMGGLALFDWYGFHVGNSSVGLMFGIAGGAIAALAALAIVAGTSNFSVSDLALFRAHDGWDGRRNLLKLYLVGVGLFSTALLGVPRLLVLSLVSGAPQPR
jgi:hypothetical protein